MKSDRRLSKTRAKCDAAQDQSGTREIRRGAVLEFAWQNMARNRVADVRHLQQHGREESLSPARNAVIWLYAKYAEKYLGETGWEDI